MDSPQRANPAADHSPQNEGQADGDHGQNKGKEDFAGGNERGQSQKRIEMEEYLDASDVVFSWESSHQQEIDKEGEESRLD